MEYNCKRCPKCRQETSADNDFCPFCGHAFKGTNRASKRKSGFGRKILIFVLILWAANILPHIIMSRSFKDDVIAFLPKTTGSFSFTVISDGEVQTFNSFEDFFDNLFSGSEPEPMPERFYNDTYDENTANEI